MPGPPAEPRPDAPRPDDRATDALADPFGVSIADAVRALEPRIRVASDAIERDRRLPDWLVGEMAAAGLYRLLIPRGLGGRGLDPVAYFDLVESLARIDSAVAWSVLISTSTTTGLVRGLPDAVVRPMIADPRAIVMGSGPPKGRAVAVPGGYRVTGRWTQGSNVEIATWVHVGCIAYDGDQPRRGPEGRPEHRMCAMAAGDVEVHDTWTTTGMRGTGSHDFGFTDRFVPEERTQIVGVPSHRPEPIFQFLGWTHVAHGALGLGIARVAIDAFLEIVGAGKRATWLPAEGDLAGRGTVQAKVGEAEALVGSSAAYMRQTLADLWATVSAGEAPTPRQRAVYRLALAQGMAHCVRAVDLMYSAGGATAIYAASPLDRCLRDAHTAHAHVWVAPDNYEIAGRLLLGVDPGTATI